MWQGRLLDDQLGHRERQRGHPEEGGQGRQSEEGPRGALWARKAGIKNWGYFIIGLPGETLGTIREIIDFSKTLPLELAIFHIAALPRPRSSSRS